MIKTNMNLKISYISTGLRVFTISLFSVFLFAGNAFAADPVFNSASNDFETLVLENRTTNPAAATSSALANWRDPISASAGDAISFRFYYHNTVEGSTANNVRLRIAYPTAASTNLVTTGTILSSNAAQVTDNATINVSSSQTITFESTAYWFANQETENPVSISLTDNGSYVEVNIGSIAGGWPSQGNVVFRANISNSSPVNNAPIVDAGSNKELYESQTVVLDGSATDPQGDAMTYAWSCNGGSLSSQNVLTPTFSAPSVNSDTTYTCTLTATDSGSHSNSDTVSILVRNNSGATAPIVNAGSDVEVYESQSVSLSGSATDPNGDSMTYLWNCSGGSLSSQVILTPTYYAPSVSSNVTYTCTLTVTDSNSNSSTDTVSIFVRDTAGATAPIVDAGTNRDIYESQSINLSGTATDPQGDAMTYLWNCSGGTLSSQTILNPIYYAPSVNSDTTYSCTLTARDSGGNSSTDTVYIIVRNSGSSSSGTTTASGGGNGNPMLNVTVSASPTSGSAPLTGVDLTASVYAEGLSSYSNIIYRFDCEDNNSWELKAESNSRNYVAQDLCTYNSNGTYTVKVKVEMGGYEAYNQTTVYVGPSYAGSAYGISVDAGTNKDISENQSTTLNGYADSQYSYGMTYAWSCNGGSLSSSTSLTPTYYAPSVSYDTTYACTLYVTDKRGYKNSDTVSIIVRDKNNSGLSVTTNFAENVTGSTANLKGTVNSDGGQSTSVRFNWGKLSSYNNYTPWISGKTTGQTFNQYISGLEKAKAYHYRVEASNGKDIILGQDVTFVTKPDSTTGFTASGSSSNQISLSWVPGGSSCYTMITRKTGSYPANSADGTVVYYGTGRSYIDKNITNNVWYYYRAWAVGCDEGLYSFADSQYAKAYTTSGVVASTPAVTIEADAIALEVLARDATQNEIAWQNSITASPDDEIEFKVIVTPLGGKSLEDVVLKTALSDKISSISNIKFDDEAYTGTLDGDVNLGTIALGESKIVTFKGKIASKTSFSYGSNELQSSVDVSAKNVASVNKTLNITATRMVEAEAGLISFFSLEFYAGALTILFIIICIIMMYLLIDRRRGKECITEKASATKVEKSKYFNIK